MVEIKGHPSTELYLRLIELFEQRHPDVHRLFHESKFQNTSPYALPAEELRITDGFLMAVLGTEEEPKEIEGKDGHTYTYWARDNHLGWGIQYDARVAVRISNGEDVVGEFDVKYHERINVLDIDAGSPGINDGYQNKGLFKGVLVQLSEYLPRRLVIKTGAQHHETRQLLAELNADNRYCQGQDPVYRVEKGRVVPHGEHTQRDLDRMCLDTLLGHTFAEMGFFLQKGFHHNDGEGGSYSEFIVYKPLSTQDFLALRDEVSVVE